MAPNKLVKATRPSPRRAHTNPATYRTSPLSSTGSDDALTDSLQRAKVFNHSNPEIRRPPPRIPGRSGSQMPMRHSYSPTHSQRPLRPTERMDIQPAEEGWQIVRVYRVDPGTNGEQMSMHNHERSSSSSTSLRNSSFAESAGDSRYSDWKAQLSQQRGSRADAMFDPSKKGWRALTNTPADDPDTKQNLPNHVRNTLGFPSGTCFVEDLPECQWTRTQASKSVDDLRGLQWIVPALTIHAT